MSGRNGYGLVKLTPAHLQVLAELLKGEDLEGAAQAMVIGGENLSVETVRWWSERAAGTRLFNEYGPTETVVGCCVYEVSPHLEAEAGRDDVPIGRPIANTKLYVMDIEQGLAPKGVAGELYIGGRGVARGYIGRGDLTAERFVPDRYSEEEGARLYRTGDLVKWGDGGVLQYLGRIDNQVKVRGYRVELGEIEVVLREHSAVKQCAVEVREDNAGKRLVGYVVIGEESAITVGELREYVRGRLPEYMVPAAIVELKQMPLTANGKLDRKALPEPTVARAGGEQEQESSPIEDILCSIWEDVLRIEGVGVSDNFFDLGGHSLLATQVMSRVRGAFNVEMPLKAMFESPTVAGLAEAVERERREGRIVEAPPIVAVSRDRQLPLSFAQQRLWFIHQLDPDSAAYNIPRAVRLIGELDVSAIRSSFRQIVARHEVLRTRFVAVDGQPIQVIDDAADVELEVCDISGLEEIQRQERAREIVNCEASRPFDLELGPVWRAGLVRLGEQDHILLLNIHHIASDAWLTGVMVREFTALYEQYSSGRQAALAELEVQYADYAVWQREWLQGEVLQEQIDYWRNQLEGAPVIELPTDRPRPAVASHQGARIMFEVPGELTGQLKALSRQHRVSLFMMLLAALDVLLFRYSGQEDICVGSPIANRTRKEIEGLIGFFVNTLVMRAGMQGAPPFVDLLKAIREVALDAYDHQDVPFEKLVEELQPDRSLSYSPLFQVMLVLQNAPAGKNAPASKSNPPGLVMSPIESGNNTAKFDLVLGLHEGDRGLTGGIEYDATLFDRTTVERLAQTLVNLLEAVVAMPYQQITLIPLLSEAERLQLVFEWNDTANGDVAGYTLIDLFNRQAKETKDSVALIFQEEHLSYYELNRQANLLGGYLQRLGVGPEATVGICMERSVEMAVALLAVLKSGAAYLPLDPAYPPERLSFMVEDARASLVLSQQHLAGRVPGCGAKIIWLDECSRAIDSQDHCEIDHESEIDGGALPDNLAYIIYTSGLTGLPKGVGLPNRALTNLIEWHRSTMLAGVRVLQFASLSFDASIHEFFAAWFNWRRYPINP